MFDESDLACSVFRNFPEGAGKGIFHSLIRFEEFLDKIETGNPEQAQIIIQKSLEIGASHEGIATENSLDAQSLRTEVEGKTLLIILNGGLRIRLGRDEEAVIITFLDYESKIGDVLYILCRVATETHENMTVYIGTDTPDDSSEQLPLFKFCSDMFANSPELSKI